LKGNIPVKTLKVNLSLCLETTPRSRMGVWK